MICFGLKLVGKNSFIEIKILITYFPWNSGWNTISAKKYYSYNFIFILEFTFNEFITVFYQHCVVKYPVLTRNT